MINNEYLFPVNVNGKTGTLLSTEPFLNGNVLYASGQTVFLSKQRELDLQKGIALCRAPNGAYARQPNLAENTSVDDLLAIGCLRYVAKDLLTTLRSSWGFMDISDKKPWSQFIFRFQGLWQHLRVSAGERLGLVGQALWALSIWLAARQPASNQDSWIQSRLMLLTFKESISSTGANWLTLAAIRYWHKKQPEPTHVTMLKYIGDPAHPLVQAWLDIDVE